MNAGVDYGAAPACSSVSLLITLDTYTRSVALLGPSDQRRFSFCHLGAGQFVLHSTVRTVYLHLSKNVARLRFIAHQ